ncbi:mobilization protein [Kocuria tytonicola]|nr:mobilization protein [Kocuria tytonicola]
MGLFSRRSTSPGTVPSGSGNRWEELLEEQPLTPPGPEPTEAEPAPSRRGAGGRPVAVEPRTRRVSMSLTEAEHRAWTEAADGQRVSVWAREQVQEQLAADTPGVGEVQELARIRADLARVGSNLNQLMRAVNQGQVVPTPQLYEAVDALASQLGALRRELP